MGAHDVNASCPTYERVMSHICCKIVGLELTHAVITAQLSRRGGSRNLHSRTIESTYSHPPAQPPTRIHSLSPPRPTIHQNPPTHPATFEAQGQPQNAQPQRINLLNPPPHQPPTRIHLLTPTHNHSLESTHSPRSFRGTRAAATCTTTH